MTGLVGQFYYEGAYQLAPDEALLVEAKVPETCGYWSLILTDDVYETTDWVNNHSSLNDAQARVDKDGLFRAVISAQDPGVPNRSEENTSELQTLMRSSYAVFCLKKKKQTKEKSKLETHN